MDTRGKIVWLGILSIIGLTLLWFAFGTTKELLRYNSLNAQTKARIISTYVEALSKNNFIIMAKYSYYTDTKQCHGLGVLSPIHYTNSWTAETDLEKLLQQDWTAWYDPSNIEDSSLSRFFPLKSLVYTSIVFALLAYFFFLGYYVSKNRFQ